MLTGRCSMRPGYTFGSCRPTVTAITKSARPFVFGAAAHRERTHNPVIRAGVNRCRVGTNCHNLSLRRVPLAAK